MMLDFLFDTVLCTTKLMHVLYLDRFDIGSAGLAGSARSEVLGTNHLEDEALF